MSAPLEGANFLVSSAGRRGELISILRSVIALSGGNGQVFTADRSLLTSAGWMSDGLDLVPSISEDNFVETLLEVCIKRRVGQLIPTIDTELDVLACSRDRFRSVGTNVWVSSPETIEIAQDKRRSNHWLKANGFPTVDQVDADSVSGVQDLPMPLIAKPTRGSSSVGLKRLEDLSEIASLGDDIDYVLETIAHGDEYTVDVLVDRSGICRAAVPRLRLETRAGEVSKGRTVRDIQLIDLATAIAEGLPGAYGVLNIQMFKDYDGTVNVIEINARFGGGFPLTWAAGCHMPLWLLQEAMGQVPTAPVEWLSDQVMLRYDKAVYLDCRSS